MSAPDQDWLERLIGEAPGNPDLYIEALTHGSASATNYERLEFLGDRVLGLTMAEWLFGHYLAEPEGQLSKRLNALVSGETCAEIAREIGVAPHLKLGKQARDDGAADSDNVLGDVVEALIGALYLDKGPSSAQALVRRLWESRIDSQLTAPQHPKSALQEWAAAHRRKPPEYVMQARSGPAHNPRFTVAVSIKGVGEASAEGGSKQEAEKAAAQALLDQLR